MNTFPQILLLAALAAGLGACASDAGTSGGAALTGNPQRVAFIDYRSKQRLELVNESHTGRIELYSETRSDASRKVQTDEVVAGLVDMMKDKGFERLALVGAAPAGGDATLAIAVELEEDGEVRHVRGLRGMEPNDHKAVMTMYKGIIDIYNATYSLQAVQKRPGEEVFKNPVGSTKKKP